MEASQRVAAHAILVEILMAMVVAASSPNPSVERVSSRLAWIRL
jgi:hypothetical protein